MYDAPPLHLSIGRPGVARQRVHSDAHDPAERISSDIFPLQHGGLSLQLYVLLHV